MSQSVSRRELLKWASAGAGATAVGSVAWLIGGDSTDTGGLAGTGSRSNSTNAPVGTAVDGSAVTAGSTAQPSAAASVLKANADVASRMLVVIDMPGGNDGLSMVVPHGIGRYYDLRPNTSIPAADVLHIDDEIGYAPSMSNIRRRGAAIIQGVGSAAPDGSHFEMLNRWWRGDSVNAAAFDTGFLGRLADIIGDPNAAAVAVSTRGGNHPALASKKVGTVGLSSLSTARYLSGANPDDKQFSAFQRGMQRYAEAGGEGFLGALRSVDGRAIDFSEAVLSMVDDSGLRPDYPDNNLTRSLSLAMSLMMTDQGVRILHVPFEGDFDTHDDHLYRHDSLMAQLDASLEAFLADLNNTGLADRVLVMTTSEFGRRAADSGSSGLDHGAASMGLLFGPVNVGRYGELPSFTDLVDDNLAATVTLEDYYATVAEGWFEVPASELLNNGASALEGVINV